jgi:hypothetical protein
MQLKTRVLCAALFAAAACASRLNATEVVTTSYAAWTATLTGSATEWNFSFPNGGSYSTAAGYSLSVGSYGPIVVTGPDGSGYNLTENSSYYDSAISRNLQTLQGASDGVGSMVFTTPAAGLTAFGLGLGMQGTASPITVTLSDGETFTANPAANGAVFLGFSSATPITSFVLKTSNGSQVELTDFDAGGTNQTASAPAAEVTTALMIGTGLLIFGARRRVFSNLSRSRA